MDITEQCARGQASAEARASENSVLPAAALLLRTAKRRRALNGYRIVGSRGCHPLPLTRHPPFSFASVPVYLAEIPLCLSVPFILSFVLLSPSPSFCIRLFSSLLPWNHTFPSLPEPAGRCYETCVRLRTRSLLLTTTLYYIDARVRTTTSGVSTTFRPDSQPPRAAARFLPADFRRQRVLHLCSSYFPSASSPREVSIRIPNTESCLCELLFIIFLPFDRFYLIRSNGVLDCTRSMISRGPLE